MCREVGNGLKLVHLWAGNPICTPIPDLTWESAELPRPRARALPFTSPWPCAEGPSCPARRVRCCQPVRFCSARSGVTVLLPAPCLRLAPLAAVGWGGVGWGSCPRRERSAPGRRLSFPPSGEGGQKRRLRPPAAFAPSPPARERPRQVRGRRGAAAALGSPRGASAAA